MTETGLVDTSSEESLDLIVGVLYEGYQKGEIQLDKQYEFQAYLDKATDIAFERLKDLERYKDLHSVPAVINAELFGEQIPKETLETLTEKYTNALEAINVVQQIQNNPFDAKDIFYQLQLKEARENALICKKTNLYQWDAVLPQIRVLLNLAKRYEKPFTVAMIDLDYFKKLNDTYGHQFGDYVLEEFAKLAKETARESDLVTRFGGEEFAAVLPYTDIEGAKVFAERLRQKLKEKEFVHNGKKVEVTISIGLAEYSGKENIKDVLEKADKAVYDVKHAGRDGVLAFGEVQSETKKTKPKPTTLDKVIENTININGKPVETDSVYVLSKSLEQTGGDVYHITETDDAILGYFGDISGHGVYQSPMVGLFKGLYLGSKDKQPAEINETMNTRLLEELKEGDKPYATQVVFKIDKNKKTLTYSNAGHGRFYLIRKGDIVDLNEGGFPVGLFDAGKDGKTLEFEQRTVQFNPGNLLVFYSDGIDELAYNNEIVGADRIKSIIRDNRKKNPKALVSKLFKKIAIKYNTEFSDDATIGAVRYR